MGLFWAHFGVFLGPFPGPFSAKTGSPPTRIGPSEKCEVDIKIYLPTALSRTLACRHPRLDPPTPCLTKVFNVETGTNSTPCSMSVTPRDRYLFDLTGYIHIKSAVTGDALAAVQAAGERCIMAVSALLPALPLAPCPPSSADQPRAR